MKRKIWIVCALGAIGAFVLAGCKKQSAAMTGGVTDSTSPAGSGTIHISYQPEVYTKRALPNLKRGERE